MSNNKKISIDIVTPTLNADKYLIHCLVSCAEINDIKARHYIVDSNSIDSTLSITNKFELNILNCSRGNMYRAINVGISAGNSEWVTYLNADDIIYPKSLIFALQSMGDDHDVIYANIDYIDDEGRFLHHWKSAETSSFAGLFASNIMPFPQQGTLFRRSLWKKLGGFREQFKYSADFDFFLRAFSSGARFGYFSGAPTAAFRLHGDQISQNFISTMQSEVRESVADAQLPTGPCEMIFAKLKMRVRNLGSYIVRFLRFLHIYKKFRFTRSIR